MGDVAPIIDPEADGYFEDPYVFYEALRAEAPVHRHPSGSWMLFRHAHVQRAWRTDELSIREIHASETPRNLLMTSVIGDGYLYRPTMTRADPPDHTRYRRVFSRLFTPRAVEQLRERIEATVDDLFAAALEQAKVVDIISQIARPLAYRATALAVGTDHEGDEQLLMQSSHAATVALMEPFPTRGQLLDAVAAVKVLAEFASDVVDHGTDQGADTALGALLAAEQAGTLSHLEVVTLTSMLFTGGHQTTYSAIGLTVLALLRNRSQWELLCADGSLLSDAVEECLRFDNTIQLGWRTTAHDYRVDDGIVIPAGCHVVMWNGSANRDPDFWGPDADKLDIHRPDASSHLSFGAGAHLCLGAWLARVEIQSVVSYLARHHPGVEVAGEPTFRRLISLRGPDRLELDLS
ncbi:MAG: cytochrome P450 [Acidimicrobiales bacterium]|nr:cytochrome P450 [Acidimicrobiales bacterium]